MNDKINSILEDFDHNVITKASVKHDILALINNLYISRKDVLEAIGEDVVEDYKNIPEGKNATYDLEVSRRAGANKLRQEICSRLGLEPDDTFERAEDGKRE
jgi:hypothetical protein